MTEDAPTAAERIAEALTAHRVEGRSQAATALMLTTMGSATKATTVARLERGAQAVTLEQALLLALATPGGLAELLAPPFTIGSLTVEDEADLRFLLTGEGEGDGLAWKAPSTARMGLDLARSQQIAEAIGCAPSDVMTVATHIYGRSAGDEIDERAKTRQAETGSEPGTAAHRAHRSHAVRAVAAEIADALPVMVAEQERAAAKAEHDRQVLADLRERGLVGRPRVGGITQEQAEALMAGELPLRDALPPDEDTDKEAQA